MTSLLALWALLGLFLFPTAATATCAEIDPLEVLPADEVCPSWVRDGDPMTAYTLEELTLIINGAAYLYDQYGFVAAAFQNYAGEVLGVPTYMTLSTFNQGSADNAAALYHDSNSGSGDPILDWSGSGEARVRVDFGYVTFQFWEECFFVTIVVGSGGEDAVPEARCIAEETVRLIDEPLPIAMPGWGFIKSLCR